MYRMTTRQKISAAKARMEDQAIELICFTEACADNTNYSVRGKRRELLALARAYAAAVDRLTRVRK
jgi:hypothetical protein